MKKLSWRWEAFEELTAVELYDLLRLRCDVFVVEQNCAYLDIDGVDQKSFHLLGYKNKELLAYLRAPMSGVKYPEASLGRVVTARSARGQGLGRILMSEALRHWGHQQLRISAQAHLRKFYEEFGFEFVHGPYDEDGIPHFEMLRASSPS